jgi:hypothetical protein
MIPTKLMLTSITRSSGKLLEEIPALELPIDGQMTKVPWQELDSFELDAEDPMEATELWVTYQGEDYTVLLPDRDTLDWNELMAIIDPE